MMIALSLVIVAALVALMVKAARSEQPRGRRDRTHDGSGWFDGGSAAGTDCDAADGACDGGGGDGGGGDGGGSD